MEAINKAIPIAPNNKPLRLLVLIHLNMLEINKTNKQTGTVKTKCIKCILPPSVRISAAINVTTDKPINTDTICIILISNALL